MRCKIKSVLFVLGACVTIANGQNLLKNGSFEGSFKYWISDAKLVKGDALDGNYCVQIADKKGLRSGSFQIKPGQEVTVSFWAKSATPANVSFTLAPSNRMVAQSVGAVWSSSDKWAGSMKTTDQWQKFTKTFSMPSLKSDGSFAGSNISWWNKTSWIIQMNTKGQNVFVDGLSIVVSDEAPEVYSSHTPIELTIEATNQTKAQYKVDGNILTANSKVPFEISAYNPTDTKQVITLETATYDYTGTTIFGDVLTKKITLESKQTEVYKQEIVPQGKGLMLIRVTAKDSSGKVLGKSDEPVTILAFPKSATKPNKDERIGASIRAPHLVNVGQKIGLGWTRWYYPQASWKSVQPDNENSWSFETRDDAIDFLAQNGISATLTLYGVPQWAKVENSRLPKDMNWAADDPRWDDLSIETGWDKYLKKIVDRYKDRVVYELVNEPDLKNHWDRKVYQKLVKRSYQIIKNTYPQAEVQVNVTWPGVSDWTRNFILEGYHKYFDTYTFHNYAPNILTTREANEAVFTLLKSVKASPKQLWFNEGWMFTPSSEDYPAPQLVNMSTADAAHIHVRSVIESFAGGVEKFIPFHIGYSYHGRSWWDWVGSGTEWWDDHSQPTVAVAAYNTMVEELGLSKFIQEVNIDNAEIYIFQNNRRNRGVMVLWSNKGTSTIKLPFDNLVKIDAVGNKFPVENSTIELTENRPWFVYSTKNISGQDFLTKLESIVKANNAGIIKLPNTIIGKELKSSEGSTYTVDGKKVWELAKVWPGNPLEAKNYKPLEWNGTEWMSSTNSHAGQPAIKITNGQLRLTGRSAWGPNNPGAKLPACIYYCNDNGNYNITSTVNYRTWDGNGKGALLLLVERNSKITKVAEYTVDDKQGKFDLNNDIELAAGDKLIITMKFNSTSVTNYVFNNLEFKKGATK